jgi:rhodanese-related sulfurtransferase
MPAGNIRCPEKVCTYIPLPNFRRRTTVRTPTQDHDRPVPIEVPAREAWRLADDGVPVIDVREPFEFGPGHVPGAVNLPLGSLATAHDQLDDRQPVIVVCASGNRSYHAVRYLRQLGYEAINLAGGMFAWGHEGLPIETGTAATRAA